MTPAQFIKLARGINDGADLDESLLKKLYQSVGAKKLAIH